MFLKRGASEPIQNGASLAWERALLTVEIMSSLVDEFFGKYLKGNTAPSLDLPVDIVQK